MPVPDLSAVVEQLRRRKIVQWTIAYLSAAWLTLQVVDVIGDQFDWPNTLERGITATLGAGLFVTVVLAWFHGEKGRQRATKIELLLLLGELNGWHATSVTRAPVLGRASE